MKNKYFICSDIHGDFVALENALKNNHFDIENDKDILVVAGDIFDRGSDSVKVYEFLKDLEDRGKAIILNGNHHEMFIDFLEGKDAFFNFKYNGLRHTIDDFLHQTNAWEMYIITRYDDDTQRKMDNSEWDSAWRNFSDISRNSIKTEYPQLLDWLKNLPDYLELKNNIITHGMLDCSNNWHHPENGWKHCHWANPREAAFMKNNTGKHIFLGHIDSDTIRNEYNLPKDNYSLFIRPDGDITYLDSCTILTHKLNMCVIEDEREE